MQKEFNLQNFIISVVIVGLVLVIGIYITSSIQGVSYATGTAGRVVNESISNPNITAGITLTSKGLLDGSCGAVTAASNGTGGKAIAIGNITQVGCVVYNATRVDICCSSATWLISYPYTYSADTNTSIAAGNITDALATGTSWISILVVVGFATIILTMLTSGLGKAATSEMGTPYY